jgi:hypothetical protein
LHLKYALEMCFSLGSLELRRITWEKSNDTALQSIIAAESVHKVGKCVGPFGLCSLDLLFPKRLSGSSGIALLLTHTPIAGY